MHKQIRSTLCILIGFIGFTAIPAQAAVDMFLCSNDFKGESKDEIYGHKDCIDVLAWSWGASQSGSLHVGGGGGAGKANFQDISITKYIDSSSTKLMEYLAKGTISAKVELFVYKAGCTDCNSSPIHKLELTKGGEGGVIVTSVSMGGSGGEERLTENVSFNFSAFKWCYRPIESDGKVGAEICTEWDIAANAPL